MHDETLRLLAVRQIELVRALLRRGHASQDKLRLQAEAASKRAEWASRPVPDVLLEARINADWSRLNERSSPSDGARSQAQSELAGLLMSALTGPAATPPSSAGW